MCNLLIIEDDEDTREALASVLTSDDCNVTSAPDGQVGLDMLRDGIRPDVIVLDMLMPRMDGLAFLRQKAKIPHAQSIPVILMTGVASPKVQRELANLPDAAVFIVQKPPDIDAIARAIQLLTQK